MKRIATYIVIALGLVSQSLFAGTVSKDFNINTLVAGSAPLWKATFLGPQGETPEYSGSFDSRSLAEYSEDGFAVSLMWPLRIDRKDGSYVNVTVRLDGDTSVWDFSAKLPEGWIVHELEFPIVKVKRDKGSKAVIPMGYGAEFEIPSDGGSLQARYPSVTGGMQFVLTHSPKGCYYFSSLDDKGAGKYFFIQGTENFLTFTQKVPASYAWTNRGEFSLPWSTVFALSDKSWEQTLLEKYRPFALSTQWGKTSLREKDIPQWMLDADVWMRPKNMFDNVVDCVRKAVKYYGPGLGIHWYHWHNHEYDTMYPEYFPPKPGFREMVAEVQKAGAHVTPYINGRLWDPANDSYKVNGYLASCRKPDGTLYTEVYPTSNVPNTVTCPSSPIWQGIVKSLVDSLICNVGTDGVYIDQISAAASEPCYAVNHPHAKGAGSWWPEAYRKLLGELHSEYFKDGKAVTSEENAEPYLDLFDMLLIVNTPHGHGVKMLPVFPLIYSDRVVYSGLNYYHRELNDGHFLYINGRSFLWGAQLGWVQPEWLFAGGNDREIKFLKTLGKFRAANHDVFLGGRFIGELTFPEPLDEFEVFDDEKYPVVMGSHWLTVDGKDAYIVVNMGSRDETVTLPDGRAVKVKAYNAARR